MKDLQINELYLVVYRDASYSFRDKPSSDEEIPPAIVSMGFLKVINRDFINLALIIDQDSKEDLNGLIIPRKAIVKIHKMKNEKRR